MAKSVYPILVIAPSICSVYGIDFRQRIVHQDCITTRHWATVIGQLRLNARRRKHPQADPARAVPSQISPNLRLHLQLSQYRQLSDLAQRPGQHIPQTNHSYNLWTVTTRLSAISPTGHGTVRDWDVIRPMTSTQIYAHMSSTVLPYWTTLS